MAELKLRNCPCCGVKIEPLEYQNEGDRIYIDGEKIVTKFRWIPCSERMPEMPIEGLDAMYSDCCLVCDSHEWIGMAYCLTDGKKTWWEFADAQNKVKIDWTEVTHWMPLSEPPEVKK